MRPSICEEAIVGDTARLKDERDGKYYWIAKLKDGNCWMVQNLALDLSMSTPLERETSDVNADWTPEYDTQITPSGWGSDNNAARSYNPGVYIYTTPTIPTGCGNDNLSLSNCTSKGWMDVSELAPSTDVNFYRNNYDQVVLNGEYDAHYLVGNYYSWN